MQQHVDVVISGCGRNHRPICRKGQRMFIVGVPALFNTHLHLVQRTGGFLR